MSEAIREDPAEPPVQPLFDEESIRKMILALARAAASSIAAGIAISTGEAQDIEATLRIQKEVFHAFTTLAYRDQSLPPINRLAEEEPAIKIVSAINRFSAAAVTNGVIGSSGKACSVGDAMRTFYRVLTAMFPPETPAPQPEEAAQASEVR